jgi:WD repeat-containing protein 34
MLAVAYGKTDHVSWCEHQSIISVWRIFTRDLNAKKPNQTIETDNCLTNIEFHPTNPLILAGGTVNGQIYIWNLDKKDKDAEQC